MIPTWCADYIGIPFRSQGRDRSGCDCYGLVRLVLSERFSLTLPMFAKEYADSSDRRVIGPLMERELPLLAGDQIPNPELGSVAVAYIAGQPLHLGVYVGDGMILHAKRESGVLLERTSSLFFRNRIEGYYRVN